ncbi:MAG: 16S rRNA (cytidine(1402)-2'-O)-methyltransferase [Bacilli bacterium]|nr:16S rRNA (cytidine(1402)-2'-O)-methyltransferase [Bacilli bacterium]
MIKKSYNNGPALYLVPTPIGNLEDITIRGLNTLKSVDIILCEDTRESGKLLKKYDITKKLISCHEFNEDKVKEKVISLLKEGKSIALITDQGTPIISDPGVVVVREVIENNYSVISLPGATAFVPALTMSGFDASPFIFYGFLNSRSAKRKKELEVLKHYPMTMIFYEAPHRIEKTLTDILDVFGDREIALVRELSKIHEEIRKGKITDLLKSVDGIKGELVLIIEGSKEENDFSQISLVEHVRLYLDEIGEKEAIKKVAKERNVPKSIVYKEYHTKKKK